MFILLDYGPDIFDRVLLQDLLLGTTGYFNRRLIYVKDLKKKLSDRANRMNESTLSEAPCDENEDLQFLKTADIDQIDWKILVGKLNSSRNLRQRMLLDKEIDIREQFPFFFSRPKLVSEVRL